MCFFGKVNGLYFRKNNYLQFFFGNTELLYWNTFNRQVKMEAIFFGKNSVKHHYMCQYRIFILLSKEKLLKNESKSSP